jgi:hypothetical protein
MSSEIVALIGSLIGIAVWTAIAHAVRGRRERDVEEIVRRGELCQGRVVAIQRPFLLDACTRLYFEFCPPGFAEPLRACHVERRPLEEVCASLPPAGATVTVRYLPDRPEQALIGKLISSLS